jgi:hypothetical protein
MLRYKYNTSLSILSAFVLTAGLLLPSLTWAQDPGAAPPTPPKPVYRCPGPPVLYTDAILPQEARELGCRTIEGAAVTIVAPAPMPAARPRPSPAAASAPGASSTASGTKSADTKVDPAAQRARDSDARRILGDELRREEERLTALQKEFNNGEPERRGDERNAAKYQERVAELKANIARKEVDVAALRRELGKLPP